MGENGEVTSSKLHDINDDARSCFNVNPLGDLVPDLEVVADRVFVDCLVLDPEAVASEVSNWNFETVFGLMSDNGFPVDPNGNALGVSIDSWSVNPGVSIMSALHEE